MCHCATRMALSHRDTRNRHKHRHLESDIEFHGKTVIHSGVDGSTFLVSLFTVVI